MANIYEELARQGFQELANCIIAAVGRLAQEIAEQASVGGGGPVQLGIRGACERLDIGETKFRELVRTGEIPEPHESGGHKWMTADLDAYARKLAKEQKAKWHPEAPAPMGTSGSTSSTPAKGRRSGSVRLAKTPAKKSSDASKD